MPKEDLADLVADLQMALYLERDPERGFRWNPEKAMEAPDVAQIIDRLLSERGLHPKGGMRPKAFIHRPGGVDYSMEGPAKERAWISGSRFEAFISADRTLSDIADRENVGRLILLRVSDLHELRDLAQELIDFMGGT